VNYCQRLARLTLRRPLVCPRCGARLYSGSGAVHVHKLKRYEREAMGGWNHAICNECWKIEEPLREPVRVREDPNDPTDDQERCCWCGKMTASGIFKRSDPQALPNCTGHKV
jgi:hypothetical protein